MAFAGIAALATAVALWAGLAEAPTGPTPEMTRFALALPEGQELVAAGGGSRIAFAPDGRSFAYTGPGPGNPTGSLEYRRRAQLRLRRLGELEAVPIAGSQGATSPVFSPDGGEIAFMTLTPFSLRVVSLAGGGAPTVVDEGVQAGGAAWTADGSLYVDAGRGLARVEPDGTGYELVMLLDTAAGEVGFAWPTVLPETRAVLVRVRRGTDALPDYAIVAFDPRDGSRKQLVRGLIARYSPTGHLVWVTADGALHAQRFDLDRLELTGEAVTLWSGVAIGGFGAVDLALSAAGDLAYTMGGANQSTTELVWVARDGSTTRVDTTTDQGFISSVVLAPDGRAAALEGLRSSGAASNLTRIWVKRLGGGPTELVTSENSNSRNPAWGSDSRDLFYCSLGGEELAVSPDGGTLLLRTGTDGAGRGDLLQFRIGIDSAAVPLLATPAHEEGPAISPDGRWLAYASDEGGGLQVYVRPFPDVNAQRVQISVDGGAEPR
jgi:eukaryotic-like serine/threonine-protein kinase